MSSARIESPRTPKCIPPYPLINWKTQINTVDNKRAVCVLQKSPCNLKKIRMTSPVSTTPNVVKQTARCSPRLTTMLTCSICLEIFHRPCTLRCGHSFCKPCLLALEQAAGNPQVPCPTCREPVIDVQNLGESISLKDMLSNYFPDHLKKCERLTVLKRKRLWIQFVHSRENLMNYKATRDKKIDEILAIRKLLEDNIMAFQAIEQECAKELDRAKVIKHQLDTDAKMPASLSEKQIYLQVGETLEELDREINELEQN
mmetsp:Transcript_11534/g.21122  ORF Transcript_11534/g.21122 Transcript_11534/m.21122 type:complete len:258 (-) Transcript_11534:2-775(-)